MIMALELTFRDGPSVLLFISSQCHSADLQVIDFGTPFDNLLVKVRSLWSNNS